MRFYIIKQKYANRFACHKKKLNVNAIYDNNNKRIKKNLSKKYKCVQQNQSLHSIE